MKKFLLFIALLASVCVNAQIEDKIPARPSPPRLVNDFTNTLTPQQVQALEQKLVAYDDSTSSQIAVVIINSTDGSDVADYAIALGRKWGVGGKEFDNGIVLLIAKQDRKLRIEVGYGLEGAIPDVTAKSIIDNDLTPEFKAGNYYRGIDRAIDDLIKAAAGEYKAPAGYRKKKGVGGIGIGTIIFIIIVISLLGAIGGGRSGGMVSRRGYGNVGTGWIIGSVLGSLGRSGGGSSGGGGGSFGGFGGGSFGGGGASGSW